MSDSTSTIERAGMLDAVHARLRVLADRYTNARARIDDAYTRADGILPEDCARPEKPEPPRLHEIALRYMGVSDNYTWRSWTTDPYWPHRIPHIQDSTLRTLNPTEMLALLEHLEDMVESAEEAADTYVGACRETERHHYAEHYASLRKLAATLGVEPSSFSLFTLVYRTN